MPDELMFHLYLLALNTRKANFSDILPPKLYQYLSTKILKDNISITNGLVNASVLNIVMQDSKIHAAHIIPYRHSTVQFKDRYAPSTPEQTIEYWICNQAIDWARRQNRSVEWYQNFLKYNNVELGWKSPVFVAAYLQAIKRMSQEQRKDYLLNSLHWKIPAKQLLLCPETQTFFPAYLAQKAIVRGKTQVMCQITLKNQYQDWTIRVQDGKPLKLGYWKNDSILVSIQTALDEIRIPREALTSPVWPVTVPYYPCSNCSNISLVTLLDNLCVPCLIKKVPKLTLKEYSFNVAGSLPFMIIKKPLVHFPKFNHKTYFGCELEYECPNSLSVVTRYHFIQQLSDFVFLKSDGSLQEGGFEIVTAPAEYEIHLERFLPVFSNFPTQIRVGSRTGMHIHVSKDAISPLTMARMVDFMHNNQNRDFIELVAERKLTSYCKQDTTRTFGYILTHDSKNTDRSVTLNIAKPPTLEFRIFQSPISYNSFAKNLDFVRALITFMTAGWTPYTPKESRTAPTFLNYLKETNHSAKKPERNPHPHLYSFLKEKGVF